ncbi:MAG TPA: hypothetical protein VJ600_00900 [Holophagaceae bacterium]|nr:hypothetical protein [Holophagaceae bacterium]
MRPWLRGLLATFGVFLVAALALIGTENWRGRRAWEAWKASREAMGDSYSWASLMPAPVPDGDNYAKVPAIEAACRVDAPIPLVPKDAFPIPKQLIGWEEGRTEDVDSWKDAIAPQGLDEALAAIRPKLDELARAIRRPGSNLRMDYGHGEIPSLVGFRLAIRALRIRAILQLRRGQTDGALADVMTCLGLAKHLNGEPNLIPFILQEAVIRISMQPIWEGLVTHRWNPRQLEAIQSALSEIDVLRSGKLATQGERLTATLGMLSLVDHSLQPFSRVPHEEAPAWMSRNFAFNQGWIYRNAINMDRYVAEGELDAIDLSKRKVNPEQYRRVQLWAAGLEKNFYTTPFLIWKSAGLEREIIKTAHMATLVDEATLACALERFRLSRGALPDRLSELAPIFASRIPHDVVSGTELVYKKGHDGAFVLYSVGWDGEDDDGQSPPPPDPSEAVQESLTGDWTWPSLRKVATDQGR